jgi:hypothetical protein
MNITLWKAVYGNGVSINLNDFEPPGGYELFLKNVCNFLGESFLNWHQGIESGIGQITYEGYKLTVFWTDFPFSLSFDCRDKVMAEELQIRLKDYFLNHPCTE